MKKRLDEVKRFQKLAGINRNSARLNESFFFEEDETSAEESGEDKKEEKPKAKVASDSEVETAVEKGMSTSDLEAAFKNIPKDSLSDEGKPKKEGKEQLNENPIGLIISALLAAPKLIEGLGWIVSKISKFFGGKGATGKSIEHVGHALEKKYLAVIVAGVRWTGFMKSEWKIKDEKTGEEKIDKQKLITVAKGIYSVILALAAISSGVGAGLSAASGNVALAGTEGALLGIKVADLKKLKSQMSGQLGGKHDATAENK
jgi:hypothetical protein